MKAPFLPFFQAPRVAVRAGSTLVATILVVAAIVTFLSIAALNTSQFGRFEFRQQGNVDLMSAADGALEYAYTQWKACTQVVVLGRNSNGLAPGTSAFPTTKLLSDLNSSSMPFNAQGITFQSVSIVLLNQFGQEDDATTNSQGTTTYNVPGYPGWSGKTSTYRAQVTLPVNNATTSYAHYGFDANTTPTLTATRYFQFTRVPLFQAAIFYENTLEIHPGAAMTVSGLVHTNGDLWARGFSTLQFKSNVSYVGAYNETGNAALTKGWDGTGAGWVPGVGPFAGVPFVTWSDGLVTGQSTTKATQLNQVSPIDPFGGASTNNNGLHDMVEVPTQPSTSTQIAYNNAGIRVIINSSLPANNPNEMVITDGSGNPLSPLDNLAVRAALGNGATSTIYDQREASNVTVTNVDMAKFSAATTPQGLLPPTPLQSSFNGTLYIHDVSQAGSSQPAIRLINGRTLLQNVSVASDNGVYIQGDYNTGGATPNLVPSNQSNPNGTAVPQAPGYSRVASSVMADAVTILSNNWVDSNSSLALSQRNATPTTVNTAIVAGDVPSNLNNNLTASGGAHNFPRFLENWNNVNFTYWGSLVEAYHSEEYTGTWQTNNVYYWPNRMWNFDTNFLTQQPPGEPCGLVFSRGRWQRN